MSKTTVLLAALAASVTKTVLAQNSEFPDCVAGPLASNSICDASLGTSTHPTTTSSSFSSFSSFLLLPKKHTRLTTSLLQTP